MGGGHRIDREQLVKYLADVHAIEAQALQQMRLAPRIAGTPELAAIFATHLPETERHEQLVRARLTALGAAPSRLKDAAGRVGAIPMLLFAKLNPDTPGKLVSHAYSYEHMEVAAYELLARVATRADDAETAAMAERIRAEEDTMARRLEGAFDDAAAASLAAQRPTDIDDQLDSYLADAHALEAQVARLLETAPRLVNSAGLARLFEGHLTETRDHERRIEARLRSRGASSSVLKDVGLRIGAVGQGVFFGAQPDTPAKLAGFAFAHEFLEVAGYEQLRRVAATAGDEDSVQLAAEIIEEERAMAGRLAERWDEALDATFSDRD